MYIVTDAYKQAMKEPVQEYNLSGTIGNTVFTENNILAGSLTISRQCTDGNDIKLGSVYIGELTATIIDLNMQRGSWKDKDIILYQGLRVADGSYEKVPLGVYRINEITYGIKGINLKAYDRMSFFDKRAALNFSNGTAYEILTLACETCDVHLGMTKTEIEKFANGSRNLGLYAVNDIETWRDVIYWVAQTLAAFATIDRQGRLILVAYNRNVIDVIDSRQRYQNAEFSDFETSYTGVCITYTDDNTMLYYGAKEDTGLTMSLGENPFMQYGIEAVKEEMCMEIVNALSEVKYVPYNVEMSQSAIAYDLGDVIRFTDGLADKTKLYCVNKLNYTYNSSCRLSGVGSNPDLASAKSKSDKNLEGLRSNVSSKEMLFFKYENAAAVTISDTESKNIIDIRFTSAQASNIIFQAEILIEAKASAEDVIGTVAYSLNEVEIQTYYPTETWKNGKHILSLMYMIVVEENQINRWVVKLNSAGGTVSIQQGGIHAMVYGQGLVGTSEWDGFITIEEQAVGVALSKSISVDDNITESVLAVMLDVDRIVLSDVLSVVPLRQGPIPGQINESFSLRWDIKYWTFDTSSISTYAKRYVDVTEGGYKLASSFVNKSSNVTIDSGLLNMVEVDNTEFESISAIELSDDVAAVKYLINADEQWYTVADGVLTEITLADEALTHNDFLTFGTDTAPTSDVLIMLMSPKIYKWTQEETISETTATVTAVPHPQPIQTRCDMSDVSIIGITDAAAVYEGNIGVRLSYNEGLVFTDEETLADAITGNMLQAYDKLDENKVLDIAFVLYDMGDTLTQFKYTFKNQEVAV
ncbi:MAG: hypothetical protein NC393_08075 [Clostridium sp.]|nr:hypothetical protein [Clostridium sp.]MCM1207654.1 hypothetical protein [Ruminococcus sp.]